MNKILILVNSLAMGGAERVSLSIAQCLHRRGCEVTLVLLEPTKNSYSTDQFSFEIHTLSRIGRPLGYFYFLKALQVRKLLKGLGSDYELVISNLYMADRVAQYLDIPNTYHCIHNSIMQSVKLQNNYHISLSLIKRYIIYKLFAKFVYNNANIITVSDGVKNDFLKFGFKPNSIQTIYNPFDFKKIKSRAGDDTVDLGNYILHIGRFDRQKRHDLLIKAFKKSKIKDHLVLVGDFNTEVGYKAKQLVNNLGLQKRVIFKGLIANPYPLIKNARCLVLSSDYEGLPTVVIEALTLKTPVISTDCESGPREILIGNLAQGLVETGNIEALAKMMRDIPIAEDCDFENSVSRFDERNISEQYIDLCEKNI